MGDEGDIPIRLRVSIVPDIDRLDMAGNRHLGPLQAASQAVCEFRQPRVGFPANSEGSLLHTDPLQTW